MKAFFAVLAASLCLLFATGADAATPPDREQDPFAPVFLVSSQASFNAAIRPFARSASPRRDSTGKALVLSEVRAHQIADISREIHVRERRCGGFFAFASAAEAERFLRGESAQQATQLAALAAYTLDNQATVNPWLSQVTDANIASTIGTLSAYKNRYYTSSYGKTSAEWIRSKWQGLAGTRTDVTTELYACANCSTQPSVILTVQGTDLPNEVVVLGAHLDSIDVNAGGNNEQVAPGADDDGSAIATLTEVIRVALASGWKPKRTVKFMGYAGEEVGLRGSNAIANAFKTAGTNVVGVLQLDMTNYKSGASVDMQLITDYSNADLKNFLVTLFDTYLAPLGLTRGTYTCGYACSDHASWTSAGYPSAMMFEAGSASGYNPNIHGPNDTLANMGNSAANSGKFAKLGLAFLGELAKTQGTTPPPPPPGNVLQKGVPVTNLSAATGASLNYTMVVPAGSQNLTFTMSGGTGDADLYVQLGSAPTDTAYLCRPYKSGNAETCTFARPTAGTYYVRLKAYAAFSGVQLVGNYAQCADCGNGPLVYTNGTDYAINDNSTVDSPIVVSNRSGNAPTNASVSVTILHTYKGDLRVDLVAPDGSLYNIHNHTGSSTDNVIGTFNFNLSSEPLNGTWKLRVNDNASGDVGKIDTWSITF